MVVYKKKKKIKMSFSGMASLTETEVFQVKIHIFFQDNI